MKSLNVRLNDEVAALIDQRQGEMRDMSVNTLINIAVRRMLSPQQDRGTLASDEAVAAALQRVITRDAGVLEALKNI